MSAYYDTNFSGSTLNVVVLTKNLLICANVGDSWAILIGEQSSEWRYEMISRDHKPTLPSEKMWIEACGGFVDSIWKDQIAIGP